MGTMNQRQQPLDGEIIEPGKGPDGGPIIHLGAFPPGTTITPEMRDSFMRRAFEIVARHNLPMRVINPKRT